MNSVAPSRRPSAWSARRSSAGSAKRSVARRGSVCTGGRGRSVGSSSTRRRPRAAPSSRRAALLEHVALEPPRCQTAKSAYWIGELRQRRRPARARTPRRARRARGRRTPIDQPSETMWCIVSSSTCSLVAESQEQAARRAGRAPGRTAGAPRVGDAPLPRLRARPPASRSRSTAERPSGLARSTWHGLAVDRLRTWCAATSCRRTISSKRALERADVERAPRARTASGML